MEIRRLAISKLRIFFYARPSRRVFTSLNNGRLRKVRLFLGTSEALGEGVSEKFEFAWDRFH